MKTSDLRLAVLAVVMQFYVSKRGAVTLSEAYNHCRVGIEKEYGSTPFSSFRAFEIFKSKIKRRGKERSNGENESDSPIPSNLWSIYEGGGLNKLSTEGIEEALGGTVRVRGVDNGRSTGDNVRREEDRVSREETREFLQRVVDATNSAIKRQTEVSLEELRRAAPIETKEEKRGRIRREVEERRKIREAEFESEVASEGTTVTSEEDERSGSQTN